MNITNVENDDGGVEDYVDDDDDDGCGGENDVDDDDDKCLKIPVLVLISVAT